MRILFHNDPVFEGAGFTFIGIDHHISLGAVLARFAGEFLLHAGGKACSAPSAQTRFQHLINDGKGFHGEGLFQTFVSAGSNVIVDAFGVYLSDVLEGESGFFYHAG
jgi:hypothetical protein